MREILLAGQQNAGKSTIFNSLTGARQHVANYPGVTVDKRSGTTTIDDINYTVTDLPGTYSLSSYSLEERVARKAILECEAATIVNVVDSANLERSLLLTIQLAELGKPFLVALNMFDVSEKLGLHIDVSALSEKLGVPCLPVIGRTGRGLDELKDSIQLAKPNTGIITYPQLEQSIQEIVALLPDSINQYYPKRWLALKLLEGDIESNKLVSESIETNEHDALKQTIDEFAIAFQASNDISVADYISKTRYQLVEELVTVCRTSNSDTAKETLSEKVDRVVLNPLGAPIFLLMTIFGIYQCSIVYGYELTNYWWPYLASAREIIAGILPNAGFINDPLTRSMGLWIVDSANTLLNYIPIFLILFALIAIIEDSGYMARIAFIADRILHRFGLHGQSTLPMILSGVFAGGCAVPGVMATKGIPDNRARLATILTVPFMNCLAKVPLYTLLLGIFFVEDKSLMMFYISTFSVIAALLVAKLLTKTVLKRTETSPFIMELPRYNLPTARSVVTRTIERTWMYVKKVGTIVVAVSTIIFVLLQFPGLPESEAQQYQVKAERAVAKFKKVVKKTDYQELLSDQAILELVNYYSDFKQSKLNAKGAEASAKVNSIYIARNATYFEIVNRKGGKDSKVAFKGLRKLVSERNKLRRAIKERRLETSLLGQLGKAVEPVSQYAGFDWKINIALLSSFAARESSVATLGVLFQQDEENQSEKLEKRMAKSEEFANNGQLAAVALIVFFILYPPCLATVMMIKVQTGGYRWMLLSITLPTFIGFVAASSVYTLGGVFNWSGIIAMSVVYWTSLATVLFLGMKGIFRKKSDSMSIPIKEIS